MSGNLLTLPPELRTKVYNYCKTVELKNLACCSRDLNAALKNLMFVNISIPWSVFETKAIAPEPLENFEYTDSITFTDKCVRQTSQDDIARNFEYLLSFACPKKLRTLKMSNLLIKNCDSSKSTFSLPVSLGEIFLTKCYEFSDVDWLNFTTLGNLTKIILDQCSIDDKGVKALSQIDSLLEIGLIKCAEVTSEGLSSLTNLNNLQQVEINDCSNIIGDGYTNLGSISSLNSLKLIDVYFSNKSVVALSNLKKLTTLHIKCYQSRPCHIGDTALTHITSLTSLEDICINWKYVTEQGFSKLHNLKSLKHLNIAGCGVIADVGLVQIGKLTTLTYLNISYCKDLNDDSLKYLEKLQSLKALDLSGCILLTDVGTRFLNNLKSLQDLCLCNCILLTDRGLEHVSAMKTLRALDISGCFLVSDYGLLYISLLTHMNEFRMVDCTRITDVGMSYIERLRYLKRLDVSLDNYNMNTSCMQVNDYGLLYISTMTSLTYLNISACDYVTDYGLSHIGKLKWLECLRISCCLKVTDKGLGYLKDLNQVHTLDISMCIKVTDIGLEHICKMTSLKEVDLHGCRYINETWPTRFKHILFRYQVDYDP